MFNFFLSQIFVQLPKILNDSLQLDTPNYDSTDTFSTFY